MIYPIVKYGDPVLEKPAAAVTDFDDELRKLVDDMFESMYAAHGVGLAAPQIGISKRIAVIDVTFKEDPEAKIVLVNPEIIHTEGRLTSNEGCLSLPEFRENVTRPRKVTARAQNLNGKTIEVAGEELLARALLHETDHLNGKLYISHISALKRDMMKRKIRKLVKQANGSAAHAGSDLLRHAAVRGAHSGEARRSWLPGEAGGDAARPAQRPRHGTRRLAGEARSARSRSPRHPAGQDQEQSRVSRAAGEHRAGGDHRRRLRPHHSAVDDRPAAARQYQSACLSAAEVSRRCAHSVGDCDGRKLTGVTTMRIDAGLDTGDILQQIEEPIKPKTLR